MEKTKRTYQQYLVQVHRTSLFITVIFELMSMVDTYLHSTNKGSSVKACKRNGLIRRYFY